MQPTEAVLCLILTLSLQVMGYNYCFKNCGTKPHVLCGVHGRCAEIACEENEPDYEWRSVLLAIHNQIRMRIANGQETRGGNGPANNMRAFSYDLELEAVAACALYSRGFFRMQCINTRGFYLVGMNVLGSTVIDPSTPINIMSAVNTWYEEATTTTAEIIDLYPARRITRTNYSMYTQLAWARTTNVGCARCRKNDTFMMMCLYAPSGNLPYNTVYNRGPAASACADDMQPNKQYPGLCGESVLPPNATEPGLHMDFLAAPVRTMAPHLYVLVLAAVFVFHAFWLCTLP